MSVFVSCSALLIGGSFAIDVHRSVCACCITEMISLAAMASVYLSCPDFFVCKLVAITIVPQSTAQHISSAFVLHPPIPPVLSLAFMFCTVSSLSFLISTLILNNGFLPYFVTLSCRTSIRRGHLCWPKLWEHQPAYGWNSGLWSCWYLPNGSFTSAGYLERG